jgi:hypothetical protein
MTESELLERLKPPNKYDPANPHNGGVIQIKVEPRCDLACLNCTQNAQLRTRGESMTPDEFDASCLSLKGYTRTIGMYGGNPALSPHFEELCRIFERHFPIHQRAIFCNHPRGKAAVMRRYFHPEHSNLNVHGSREAWDEFRCDWPEARVFGLHEESRHSPCFTAMKDLTALPVAPVVNHGFMYSDIEGDVFSNGNAWYMEGTEANRNLLISTCKVNATWSAIVGPVPGKGLRAYFCEISYTMAVHHHDDPEWPDTGHLIEADGMTTYHYQREDGQVVELRSHWWRQLMPAFAAQVRQAFHSCGVPLGGYGALSQDPNAPEQVSQTHVSGYEPKRKGRRVELVTVPAQLGPALAGGLTEYIHNAAVQP